MSREIEIVRISIKDNLTIVDGFLGKLHLSELLLNPKTAKWEVIKNEYLQHMLECEEEADGKFFVARDHHKPIGFIFGYVEEKDNSNFEVGDGDDLYVSEGYVDVEYRNEGVYARLNSVFTESYSNRKLRRIFRYTLIANKTMQQWLENNGFLAVRKEYEKWL